MDLKFLINNQGINYKEIDLYSLHDFKHIFFIFTFFLKNKKILTMIERYVETRHIHEMVDSMIMKKFYYHKLHKTT